jgi:RNA polymerase-interacting CarD/CdnL/TRCF family regulator
MLTAVSKKTSKRSKSRWSARVTKQSDALDLETAVFKKTSPRKIALSLRRSAKRSKRRKGSPYQSAMSMLNFYINRAGKNLPQKQKRVLEQAKHELRDVFGRA